MSRFLTASLLAVAVGATAATAVAPASAAERCRPRPGEHQLARSTQAVVFARSVGDGQKAISGCSRRSGHRRAVATTRLVGLRLAGTRIAYATSAGVIADDALHGGRHHDLTGARPLEPDSGGVRLFAVDDQGDVAWTTRSDTLMAWRAGLSSRQVDARAATIDGVTLRSGVLRWRRDGAARSVDLKRVPRSACERRLQHYGTLAIDAIAGFDTLCLRAGGRTTGVADHPPDPMDANGTYFAFTWVHVSFYGARLVNVADGSMIAIDPTPADPNDYAFTSRQQLITDVVVDEHGSYAWVAGGTLWAHDAAGTRAVPGTGTGRLVRHGSTVTWSGGGPSVTLNP